MRNFYCPAKLIDIKQEVGLQYMGTSHVRESERRASMLSAAGGLD